MSQDIAPHTAELAEFHKLCKELGRVEFSKQMPPVEWLRAYILIRQQGNTAGQSLLDELAALREANETLVQLLVDGQWASGPCVGCGALPSYGCPPECPVAAITKNTKP